jgi:hypothetical protein
MYKTVKFVSDGDLILLQECEKFKNALCVFDSVFAKTSIAR